MSRQSPPTVNGIRGKRDAPAEQAGAARRVQPSLQRVIVERIRPSVDGGRFAVKRTIGDIVTATADIFADGHDVIVAILRDRHRLAIDGETAGPGDNVRRAGDDIRPAGTVITPISAASAFDVHRQWRETPMTLVAEGTDEWAAEFDVAELGWHEFSIVSWVDPFLSWRRDLELKVRANQKVALELLEGSLMVRAASEPAQYSSGTPEGERLRSSPRVSEAAPGRGGGAPGQVKNDWLLQQADLLTGNGSLDERVRVALSRELAEAMAARADRSAATTSGVYRIWVDRERARFSTWYEMFPRSAGSDPTRSATFKEAAARLPAIADLGFDVLYLPPIHPIGRSFRKGRNNALVAAAADPGSPWAIGAAEGGHTAVEPGLGTLADFEAFRAEAERLGLEVALDLAWQCSPDHPWVREHPEWFRRRPDGTIKYAENPPKKYQDIYPFDFGADDWRGLWHALLDVTCFWAARGVRVFRVDNPHTKTFGFWEWLIDQVHARYPDAIFLSEAFTRPKVMRYLAKAGFSQSYTYFTWRNSKDELTAYFTELSGAEVREYFRPNLFANTPDILHAYLQGGGRPAFEARLLLAATLGASYGIYSGFELCEGRAVPGTEEYADSEKYQIRQWNWDRPGHIKELIARVNRIRRAEAALQTDRTLQFHATDNPYVLAFSKRPDGLARPTATPGGRPGLLLMVVNLDPHRMQHGFVQVPLRLLGRDADPGQDYPVVDLLDNALYSWKGEWNYVRLEPGVRQGHILKLEIKN